MLVVAPPAPKDHVVKYVTNKVVSNPEHTPNWIPRVTQTTFGQFAFPVFPSKKEKPAEHRVQHINERVLDGWTTQNRAWWVVKPGEDAFFVDKIFRKHSVIVDPELDLRYKHKPSNFPRPYKYEIDCIEERRLKRLHRKAAREEAEDRAQFDHIYNPKVESMVSKIKVITCEPIPPFWWKEEPPKKEEVKEQTAAERLLQRQLEDDDSPPRMLQLPNYFSKGEEEACTRRLDMTTVNQPFMSDACNWYYDNFPRVTILHPDKFAH